MRPEARRTLAQIRTLTRLEAWIRCAKAELASTPDDELLAEFVRANKCSMQSEKNYSPPKHQRLLHATSTTPDNAPSQHRAMANFLRPTMGYYESRFGGYRHVQMRISVHRDRPFR